ncbi:dihydrofolate reductase [Synchytrium microbalum]|uniref:Dihydrofolate reductase n=1 Tax=Synchytrium microbalum TaxID=1806994 RepID=A0A507CG45_9FUNG|nr:dihydrofolate reductase [Synchytrium microbalum]TPX38338.1 dihydrofolate reductase [Synchytrium microbalum]
MGNKEETRPPVQLSLIAAATPAGGIGINGKLPWKLPTDMAHFELLTTHLECDSVDDAPNVVIMGRKTWDSVPLKYKPFKNRISVILSHNEEFRRFTHNPTSNVYCFPSLDDCVDFFGSDTTATPHSSLWIIGGTALYSEAMRHRTSYRIFLTRVYLDNIECDAFFENPSPQMWELASNHELRDLVGHLEDVPEGRTTENGIEYEFFLYTRRTNEVQR